MAGGVDGESWQGGGGLGEFLLSFAPFPPNDQMKGFKTQEEEGGGVGRSRVG